MTAYKIIQNRIVQGNYDNTMRYPSHCSSKKELKEVALRYSIEEQRLYRKFKEDLEMEHHLQDHPKKDILWRLAWEIGHSSGFDEVLIFYNKFSELLI